MERAIITDINNLPDLSSYKQLIMDVETTSFDDNVAAFHPFHGHRILGVGISTPEENRENRRLFYFPLRHKSKDENLPISQFMSWINDLFNPTFKEPIDLINQNCKFDGKFWWQDGIWFEGKLIELLTLSRLCYTDLPSFSLESLALLKLPKGSGNENLKRSAIIKAYLRSISSKCKDYANVPINMMGMYCMQDCILTGDLYHQCLKDFPPESKELFETETSLLKHLLIAEINGMSIDAKELKKQQLNTLRELLSINEKINEILKMEVDPNKDSDQSLVFLGKLCLDPVTYTDKGSPQWNAVNLRSYGIEVCNLWADYLEKFTYYSTFLEGWSGRLDSDGILHATINPYGTVTGRMSSSDPNIQNIPEASEIFIVTPSDEYCIVYFDYSQAEYRMFAHYTGEPNILDIYAKDARADFHQALADKLGLRRRPTKNINFGMLYGMGKGKLIKMLSEEFIASKDDELTKKKLLEFCGREKGITEQELESMSAKVLMDYHIQLPSIKRLTQRIKDTVMYKKQIKSIYGRVFQFSDAGLAYKGLNWLIQGSTSDMVKKALNEFLNKHGVKRPREKGVRLFNTVHDSGWFYIPKEIVHIIINEMLSIFEVKTLKVPVIIDIESSDHRMSELKVYAINS